MPRTRSTRAETHVRSLPSLFLSPSVDDEVFDNLDTYQERIQGWEEREEEESEQAVDDAFMPPSSTAPAILQPSRAGRKRAPTMKALEAELASKRGTGQGAGKAAGRGRGRGAKG
jgi:hypothetical protein